jgi:hypothetical protein
MRKETKMLVSIVEEIKVNEYRFGLIPSSVSQTRMILLQPGDWSRAEGKELC